MKKYEKYKEVGLPWLKEVPEGWEVGKNRNIFRYKKEINKNGKEKNVLSLTLRGVINNDIENPIGLSPKDYATYQLFEKNDLVFKLIDLNNVRTSRVGVVHESGIMSSAYIRLCIKNKIGYHKYFYYWFFKLYIEEVFNKLGNGVRETIGKDELLNMTLPIPPLHEQEQIANFLDWKISEIDRLIELEQKKIDEIKFLKTKIIDKYMSLESDNSVKLKFLGRFVKGRGIARENLSNLGEYSVILYGDIYTKYNFSFSEVVNKIDFDFFDNAIKTHENTLLFPTSGETKEDIGKTVLYEGKETVAIGGDVLSFTISSEEINAKYLMYFLNSTKSLAYKYVNGRGDIIVHISETSLNEIIVNFPSMDKQIYIADRISHKFDEIEMLLCNSRKQISYLEELKQTLISDAVTGKIDVRNIKIPDYTHGKEEA